jgi:hypothetical protein
LDQQWEQQEVEKELERVPKLELVDPQVMKLVLQWELPGVELTVKPSEAVVPPVLKLEQQET